MHARRSCNEQSIQRRSRHGASKVDVRSSTYTWGVTKLTALSLSRSTAKGRSIIYTRQGIRAVECWREVVREETSFSFDFYRLGQGFQSIIRLLLGLVGRGGAGQGEGINSMARVAVKSVGYCGFHFRPTSPPFQIRRDLTIEAAQLKRERTDGAGGKRERGEKYK